MITNKAFLSAIFGDEWGQAHVTAFTDDPSNIEGQEQRMRCWAGGPAGRRLRSFTPDANQYFTISLFRQNDKGEHRRQKTLFDACFVIVLDDVAEKIAVEDAQKLPPPSYKLLTSAGSEQWGYILAEPDARREVIDNLLEGLVAQGLAPDGKDPGMKGVTRYVRLPEGSNTKAKRYVDGKPFSCELISWDPERLHSVDALADAFGVDLYAPRNETESQALNHDSEVYKNHPVWSHVDVTGYNNEWALIDCPNVDAHSDDDDPTGAAVMVREDGSIAFKCHHGSCSGEGNAEKMTGVSLVKLLGVEDEVNQYIAKIKRDGAQALAEAAGLEVQVQDTENKAGGFIVERDDDTFNLLRYVYLMNENKFFDVCSGGLVCNDALKNLYLREWTGKKNTPNAVEKFHTERNVDLCVADKLGWVPWSIMPPKRSELIVNFTGKKLVNTWRGLAIEPSEGDVTPWLDHLHYLIQEEAQREVILDYFASIFQAPMTKPGYTILHRGGQGCGKDMLLKPLMRALGTEASGSAKIDSLIDGWGDYLAKKKFIIIEEVDKSQSRKVNNALKTILAPTATGTRDLNLKGGAVITQQDCLATYMMTNRKGAVTIEKDDRRYYVVDSYVTPRDPSYYQALDSWYMDEGGIGKVVNYLLNRDIRGFNPLAVPERTEAFNDVLELGLYDYEILLKELHAEQKPPFNLPLFTLTTLKNEAKKQEIKCVVPSLIEAVESLGFVLFRGTKKVDGQIKNTPKYFVKKTPENNDFSRSEQFDFYENYLNMGAK